MRTTSTSLERTPDINTASASKFPRNAFILTVKLLEQTGRGFLIAEILGSSSSGPLIELGGCGGQSRGLLRLTSEAYLVR